MHTESNLLINVAKVYLVCRGYSDVVLLPFCDILNLICDVVISILWCCKKLTFLNNFRRALEETKRKSNSCNRSKQKLNIKD